MRIELENMERMNAVRNIRSVKESEYTEYIGGQSVNLQNLQRYALDYQEVPLEGDCICYCDMPYKGTNCRGYAKFDHDRFYEWVLKQTVPVYISEYWMPDDFVMVKSFPKRQLTTQFGAGAIATEGIWVPRNQVKELKYENFKQMDIFDWEEWQ